MPAGRLRVNRVVGPECTLSLSLLRLLSLSVLWLLSVVGSTDVGVAVVGMAPVTRP